MENTRQTLSSFRDKWTRNQELAFSETLREGSEIFNWILNRNGFFRVSDMEDWLSTRSRILDAGCGNGRITALLRRYAPRNARIVGIDLTSADICARNLDGLEHITIYEKDILGDLTDLGRFDLIYCQEVLHHTGEPRKAFLNLCNCLSDDGEMAIYVYKIKAPVREYSDDFVRSKISELTYDEALKAMCEITELGKVLADLDVKVMVPEVKVLGIEAGEYNFQRFLYHFFLKCFWNPSLSFEENSAINYDWYHPQLSSRHTLDEVESWFAHARLKIIHRNVDHYGITVRGVKSV